MEPAQAHNVLPYASSRTATEWPLVRFFVIVAVTLSALTAASNAIGPILSGPSAYFTGLGDGAARVAYSFVIVGHVLAGSLMIVAGIISLTRRRLMLLLPLALWLHAISGVTGLTMWAHALWGAVRDGWELEWGLPIFLSEGVFVVLTFLALALFFTWLYFRRPSAC